MSDQLGSSSTTTCLENCFSCVNQMQGNIKKNFSQPHVSFFKQMPDNKRTSESFCEILLHVKQLKQTEP